MAHDCSSGVRVSAAGKREEKREQELAKMCWTEVAN